MKTKFTRALCHGHPGHASSRAGRPWHVRCARAILAMPVARAGRPWHILRHGHPVHGLLMVLALLLAAGLATSCRGKLAAAKPDPLVQAYDSETDWNDPQRVIPLNYQQAQGKRVFYQYCVWCHADATPAGPSNRSNLNPNPALANDGAILNPLSDEFMRTVITSGGGVAGKSIAMPPWGKTLSQDDIDAVIAFYRAIAQPSYQPPARPGPKYSVR